jgi:DNA-binding NarL/FixJ family response regulator
MVIGGIEKFIQSDPAFEIVGTGHNPEEVIGQILILQPEILIFDYQLPGVTGLEIFKSLRLSMTSLKGICYTQHSEAWIIQKLIKEKINGLVLKSEDPSILMKSVVAVSRGEEYLSPLVSQIFCSTYLQSQSFRLTKRELEVLNLIALGHSSKETADQMNLSNNTVEDYRKNLMEKLKVKNTAELVHKATKMGFI